MNRIYWEKITSGLSRILASFRLERQQALFLADGVTAFLSLYLTIRLLLAKDIQSVPAFLVLKHCFVFTLLTAGLKCWKKSDHRVWGYIRCSLPQTLTLESSFEILGYGVLANLFYHPLMILMGGLSPLTPFLNICLYGTGLLLVRLISDLWGRKEIRTCSVGISDRMPAIVVGYNAQIEAYLRNHKLKQLEENTLPYAISGIFLLHPLPENGAPPPFPVLGMIQDFIPLVQKLSAQGQEPRRLLIAREALGHLSLRQIILKFHARGILGLVFEAMPPLDTLTLSPLQFTDLLGKVGVEPSSVDAGPDFIHSPANVWREVASFIDSASIMVTGIQDQVVYQLACQIAGFNPGRMVITSPSEHALANLREEIQGLYPTCACHYILTSVTDHDTIENLVKIHHPGLVFHGDRLTQPDLIALSPLEAVQKNILSALHFAHLIQKTEASTFVLVNARTTAPLAQTVSSLISQEIQRLDQAHTKSAPRFLVINSCDIWGNLDSPSAFWEQQLGQGLAIRLASADAYSYLLSASEAARTILQAVIRALDPSQPKGQLLQLHGGEPARFYDLVKSFAVMKGYNPDTEIRVDFDRVPDGQPAAFPDLPFLQEMLTPGVMSFPSPAKDDQNQALMIQLVELVKKRQTDRIEKLLAKLAPDRESSAAPVACLDMTG